ncbi:hypothetical protein XELAEV_18044400mg [Xenopus laevis]|uniref:Uncharacterized protein n=1 Tax=Xenopus laevis TaxID=8355 RepID=A0A974H390_XENLA|nr:hypothetical protein XELAEV_18044400mg [Xenopus laevis]
MLGEEIIKSSQLWADFESKVNSSFHANFTCHSHSHPLNWCHLENMRLSDIYFNILTWTLDIYCCEKIQLEPCHSIQMPRVQLAALQCFCPHCIKTCIWICGQNTEIFSRVENEICLLHFAKKLYFSKNIPTQIYSKSTSPWSQTFSVYSILFLILFTFQNLMFTAFCYFLASFLLYLTFT